MAFRRQRDEWTRFVREHAEELRLCGIPKEVSGNRIRFFVFLDHGYDEWGWAKTPHNFFDSRLLSDEQITRLADFVARYFDEYYRVTIASRWQGVW